MIYHLHKQYPFFLNRKESFSIMAVIGLLVFAIYMVFKPYGLNTITLQELFFIALINGAFVFLTLACSHFILLFLALKHQKEENWTILKEILVYIWHLVFYGGTAFLTSYVFDLGNREDWSIVAVEIPLLLSIFIIPLVLLLKKNFVLQKNTRDIQKIDTLLVQKRAKDTTGSMVSLISNDKQGIVPINAEDIIGIQSAENYVEIFYMDEGISRSILLRNTLKAIHGQLLMFDFFLQCHRSYIVNLKKVLSFKGNSKGYLVMMEELTFQIPVSRSKLELFRKKMEILHGR